MSPVFKVNRVYNEPSVSPAQSCVQNGTAEHVVRAHTGQPPTFKQMWWGWVTHRELILHRVYRRACVRASMYWRRILHYSATAGGDLIECSPCLGFNQFSLFFDCTVALPEFLNELLPEIKDSCKTLNYKQFQMCYSYSCSSIHEAKLRQSKNVQIFSQFWIITIFTIQHLLKKSIYYLAS